ncbi:exodeoxyribonuclease III [Coraliomargarita sp. SDUM461004]|uniref:Exodeoxyribonuclease III n=1 Tax=Thalassobacterium sedimentorum TaxID=3041258 RepID=A0ABU1AF49_9BACT|nr:exodeoxyribonuclease III [Coraliomargarita sp. SDUM461004]MDQ8193363.1 exodeoxyribonuclease III [Coraliomargarita sp. SDUM461004]
MATKKLLSWNVNGLRAVLRKGFLDILASEQPDVICLQETKISDDLIEGFTFEDYPYVYWNCATKKGYSGTAILSKTKPLSVQYGLGIEKHDNEGRVITAEFEDHYLVTVYTPNAQNHDKNKRPRRLDYRTEEWDVDFLAHVKKLEAFKPVIFCGDLNVAHTEIDISNPKTNSKNAGFTIEERTRFDAILEAGFIDTFRLLHPAEIERYSWWSYRATARQRNIGWRIDYFCVSNSLRERIADADILDQIMGSDHCPVLLQLK